MLRDRLDPFTFYDDDDFVIRYRLGKHAVLTLLNQISHKIEGKQVRTATIPPYMQLLVALRFYATGAFLLADGDLFGIHECSVSIIIKRVSMAIASLKGQYIIFPVRNCFFLVCNFRGYIHVRKI